MNLLHRLVGFVNIFFLILLIVILPVILTVVSSFIGGTIIVAILGLLLLTGVVWGIRNAFFYWRSDRKLGVGDHILLAAGVFNGLLLLLGLGMFIYIGEQ